MKWQRLGLNKCRLYILLGLWILALSFGAGSYVRAVGEPDSSSESEETPTVIPMDGVFSAGGLNYEASESDFETEEALILERLESDGSSQVSETPKEYTSAEEAMSAAFDNYETVIPFPTDADTAAYTVEKSEVTGLVNRFLNSHPEYFYIKKISFVSLSNGLVKNLNITYIDSPEAIGDMRADYQKEIALAASRIDTSKLDAPRICALVHDYLVSHITYETDTANDLRYSAYSALVKGKAVCQGYALAYQAILNQLGIPCIMVASESMDHAWNLVKINDYYYHVDVTWDDSNTMPGQVYHSNLLLNRDDIESIGHKGYALAASVKDNIAPSSIRDFWQNVYSEIYYYEGALYYMYPEEVSGEEEAVWFKLVKKPLEGEALENVNLVTYKFADVQVSSTEGEDTKERLASLLERLKAYARLVRDGSNWYFTSAYGIYKVDMETGKQSASTVAADEVFRLADMKEDSVVFGMTTGAAFPMMNGLAVKNDKLFYQLEGGSLTEVPEYTAAAQEPQSLYVYEGGKTITLSVREELKLHPYLFPDTVSQQFTYQSSADNLVSVSADGVVTARAYTRDTPVTITITGGGFSAEVYIEVVHLKINELMLSNGSITLQPGETKKLGASVSPGNATCQDFEFSSLDETGKYFSSKVITVDETGLVTAVAPGTAYVNVRVVDYELNKDGTKTVYGIFEKTCKVKVEIKATAITLNQKTINLKPGESSVLGYTLSPAGASDNGVVYKSSNTLVAVVSADGTVTAKAEGQAVITAATSGPGEDELLTDTCQVTVENKEETTPPNNTPDFEIPTKVEGVRLDKGKLTMSVSDVAVLTATVLPSSAINQDIIWVSSDKSVVKVKKVKGTAEATVTAVGMGTAEVRVTTAEGAFTASCRITVGKPTVANAVVTGIGKKVYTGKAIRPSLTVKVSGKKLKVNKDYKLTYKNNKKIGKATITIKGIGNYKGTKRVTFMIVPGKPKASMKAGKGSVYVTYKKVNIADGYQIVYARNKTFTKGKKSISFKQKKVFSTVVKKLKSGTVYYFKIRSYKLVSGKRVYSGYYNMGKVKVK